MFILGNSPRRSDRPLSQGQTPSRCSPPRNMRALTEDIYGEPKPSKRRPFPLRLNTAPPERRTILWCHSPRNIRAASTRQRRLSNHLGRYNLLSRRISKRTPYPYPHPHRNPGDKQFAKRRHGQAAFHLTRRRAGRGLASSHSNCINRKSVPHSQNPCDNKQLARRRHAQMTSLSTRRDGL